MSWKYDGWKFWPVAFFTIPILVIIPLILWSCLVIPGVAQVVFGVGMVTFLAWIALFIYCSVTDPDF